MLDIIFFVALIWVSWKMFVLGIKAAWGIAKIVCTVFLMPVVLIGMVLAGLIYIAIPIMAIVGLFVLIGSLSEAWF